MHATHPEFVPAIVILGTAAMTHNKADRAGTALYERAPTRRRRLDGEGGGGRTERAVVAEWRGQWRRDGEGGRPAAGAWRGWAGSMLGVRYVPAWG